MRVLQCKEKASKLCELSLTQIYIPYNKKVFVNHVVYPYVIGKAILVNISIK